MKIDRSYTATETFQPTTFSSGSGGTHVEDDRNGQRHDAYLNPTSATSNGEDAGQVIDVVSTRSTAAEFAAGGSSIPSSSSLVITHEGLTGGSNLFPASIESPPYFKTNYNAVSVAGTYNTMGQHLLDAQTIHCYGVGDCLIGSQFITSSGGVRDEADEGAHPFDLQMEEDTAVFQGTCSAGCSPGSTVVTVATTSGAGTQGEGRYLIDKNPAKVISAGTLTGGTGQNVGGPADGASFIGTNFPVSVFLATAQVIPSQANNVAPGTVTVPIATSGVASGFATNTTAIPSPSGVACIADQPMGFNPHNYEMANYTVVDGTHLTMTLNKVHRAGATIAFGGLCGYGLEQTVDTVGQIRQIFPVVGSYSPTGLYYGGALTAIVGLQGNTSAFLNVTIQIASVVRSNDVVTVTAAGALPMDVNGLTMTVAGVTDQSYNGTFTVTTTGTNTLTYAQTGANSTSTGGSVSKVTGGYVLYPMAEVLGVFDTATKSVDGQLTLAANTVSWGANDPVEQPHYYQQSVAADVEFVGQTTPRPSVPQTAGVQYQLNVGPGLAGWTISNAAPVSNYFGNGGTHTVPFAAYTAAGVWQRTMDMQAGEQSVFAVHCNSHGCGNWNSGYNLFTLDSSVGGDRISYQPQTSTLTMEFGSAGYSFSPQGFTATTINAGTVNATTLNGTVSAGQLPLFVGSGSGHEPGAVPDPGATAGSTRYLREDGTWAVPAGGVGSGQSTGGGSTGSAATIAGATADYNFLQGAGTTLTDGTGNGNNGTLGAGTAAPTWTSSGLEFSIGQNVALPSALNASRTVYVAFYSSPGAVLNANNIAGGIATFVTSSLGAGGLNLFATDFDGPNGTQLPTVESGSNAGTVSSVAISGFNVLTYTVGNSSSDLDHVYLNGIELPYASQTFSGGSQSSGFLYLGTSNISPFSNIGLVGTMYRAVFETSEDTPAQIAANYQTIVKDMNSRGVAMTPQSMPIGKPTLYAVGDSITFGLGVTASQAWPLNLTLTNQPAYAIVNAGIPSQSVRSIAGSEPNRIAPFCANSAGPTVAILFAGTNDVGAYGYTAAQAFASTVSFVTKMRKAGCLVFAGTMISRGSSDAAKDSFDALLLDGVVKAGANGVVDFAANPLLGADGANTNATDFQADNIHPTPTGQLLLSAAASNALNYYFGSSSSNPTVVTATHTIAAGEGYITVTPTANATLTLPDCTGQSGATYTVSNTQSAFTVGVVTGSSAQLINGIAAGTAVSVPSNSSVSFRDVPNPKTLSGCHWEK